MKTLILIILTSFIYCSCQKPVTDDDAVGECEITVANILGSYKVVAARYQENSRAPQVDYMDQMFYDDCEKDDIVSFEANGVLKITDAGVQCVPPADDQSTWTRSGNIITVEQEDAIIESLNCQTKTMVLKYKDWDIDGDILRVTFQKQ